MSKEIKTIKLILVEDSAHDAEHFNRTLSRDLGRKWEVRKFVRAEEALEVIAETGGEFDIFVANYSLPGIDGLDFCKRVLEFNPLAAVVLITGLGSENIAAEAIRAGVGSYIIKDQISHSLALLPELLDDVISKAETKRKLALSETYLERAQNISHIGHWSRKMPSGNFSLSSELCRIYDLPIDVTIDVFLECIHPDDREMFDAASRRVVDLGEAVDIKYRITCPNGEKKWIRAVTETLRNDAGDVIEVIGTTQDITETKKEEKALIDSKNMFLKALGVMPGAIAISSVSDGKYLYVNPESETLYGYSAEEVIGKRSGELNIWVDTEHRDEYISDLQEKGQVNDFPIRVRSKSGEIIPVLASATTINFEKEQCIVSWAIDQRKSINAEAERKKLEFQLSQSQKMQAIGQLTGGIAHDFNNILQMILGFCQLAKLEVDAKTQEQLAGFLEKIQHGGERAQEMIEQMMIFSRSKTVESSPQLLSPLIETVLKILRPSISTNIGIDLVLPSDLPKVMINPVQFEQVIMNLCINARDAIAKHGVIKIELKEIQIAEEVCNSCHEAFEGKYLELIVADSGQGISEKVMQSMFDPFFSTKKIGEGAGMGLPMVHGIMHNAGGHILVDVAKKNGAVFHLLFPVVDSAMQEQKQLHKTLQTKSENPSNRKTGRILIVDDEPAIAEYLSRLLELNGYDTVVSNGSEDALSIIKSEGVINLVITDMTMPGLSGLDLANEIIKLYSDMPIILCSGNITLEEQAATKETGVSLCLSKPIDSKLLLNKIDELLPL